MPFSFLSHQILKRNPFLNVKSQDFSRRLRDSIRQERKAFRHNFSDNIILRIQSYTWSNRKLVPALHRLIYSSLHQFMRYVDPQIPSITNAISPSKSSCLHPSENLCIKRWIELLPQPRVNSSTLYHGASSPIPFTQPLITPCSVR